MRSNPIALALANYTKVVNDCFGGMSDPRVSIESNESEAQNG